MSAQPGGARHPSNTGRSPQRAEAEQVRRGHTDPAYQREHGRCRTPCYVCDRARVEEES